MKYVTEKALNGNRKAMEYLYLQNRKRVLFACYCILKDMSAAEDAAIFTFKNIWADLAQSRIISETHFTYLAVKRAAEYCKRLLIKKDSKALRAPNDKNFVCTYKNIGTSEKLTDTVLFNLNDLQRFALVLHTVGEYNNGQLAEATKMDLKTLQSALIAIKGNVRQILSLSGSDGEYDDFADQLKMAISDTVISQELDRQALMVIDSIATPKEKHNRITASIIAAVSVIISICIIFGAVNIINSLDNSQASVLDQLAEITYYADIDIKDYGTISVALDGKTAPISTQNFVKLANDGFYNGLTFHRIIEGFMMQGGDPDGNGTGGSEEKIKGEFSANGVENNISHLRGVLSMARSNDYNSASSQFFIMHEDNPSLDGMYAAFGCVTDGMEIVDKICEDAKPTDNNGTIPSANQPKINTVTIRKP